MRQPLGAINKTTQNYIYPKIANKNDIYICPDCSQNLVFCNGKIKVPYFRHAVIEHNPCTYYDKPNESQIHKDAKLLLKKLLEDKCNISFTRKCESCDDTETFDIKTINKHSEIKLEHTFEYNGKKIADIAYIHRKKLLYIFEICNTHKTNENDRPNPWFEICALDLINLVNSNDEDEIVIPCIRETKCGKCYFTNLKNDDLETYVRKILGQKHNAKFSMYLSL